MKFEDCYPAEIVEWANAIPEPEACSPQQLRIHKILTDEEVIKKSKHVFKQFDRTDDREEAITLLDNFCAFIEDAAALPDRKPSGARWHLDQYAEFHTKSEVEDELRQVKLTVQPLLALLERRSDLILFDKIDELQSLLKEFLASPQMSDPYDKSLPNPGQMAGENNWRNVLYRSLSNMAEVRLGNSFQAFTREVHRVLLGLDMPLDPNTAKSIVGPSGKSDLSIGG